jgi:hypothetical protein
MTLKAGIYARSEVPEYWAVAVEGRLIHQMWEPENGNYAAARIVVFCTPVTAATLNTLMVNTGAL